MQLGLRDPLLWGPSLMEYLPARLLVASASSYGQVMLHEKVDVSAGRAPLHLDRSCTELYLLFDAFPLGQRPHLDDHRFREVRGRGDGYQCPQPLPNDAASGG